MSVHISKNSEWDSLVPGKQQLVAVDFWTPLCPCCSAFKPVFESASPKDQDTEFAKVNFDQMPDIASKNMRHKGYLLSSFSVRAEGLEKLLITF